MKRTWFALPVVCLLLIAVNAPAAEPLADRLPAGTLAYLGWAGKTKVLDESMVGKLLQEPGLAKMFDALREAAAFATRRSGGLGEAGWDVAAMAVRHPIALALIDVQAGQGPPDVSAAFLIDLGADRREFAKKLDALIEKAGMELEDASAGDLKYRQLATPAGPLGMGYLGDTLFLCLGKSTPKLLAGIDPAKSLATDKSFVEAMKAVSGANLQLAFYADAAGLTKKVQKLLEPQVATENNKGPGFTQVMQSLGLAGLKSMAGSLRVTDGLFHTKMRLVTPAPHRGVLLPFAGEPLTDADLAALPDDTDFLAAGKFSAEGIYNEIRRITKEFSPEVDAEITREMLNPKGLLSALAVKDILGGLGQTWTLSCAQSYGGLLAGTLVTVEVKDAAKIKAAVGRLETFLRPSEPTADDEGFGRFMRGPTPALRVAKSGDVEVHYVSFSGRPMPFAPAWAVHKGRLYVAGWPQIIFSAIDNQGKGSLVKNADFAALRAKLGGKASIITYLNVPRLLRQGYPIPLMLWTAAGGMWMSDKDNGPVPDWLPPLSVLEKYVRPEISGVSADKDGITIEGYGTVPGLAAAPLLPPVAVAVLMPGLSRARLLARRASSLANLSAIGKGVAIWSAANKDQYPPDLDALVEDGQAPGIMVSPLSGRQPPKFVNKKLVGEVDYIYLKGVGSDAPSDLVLAYERPENHKNEGTNVLYADLHVAYVPKAAFDEALKKTQEYLKNPAAAKAKGKGEDF